MTNTKNSPLKKAAQIVNTHGVKGLVKLNPTLSSLDPLLELNDFFWEDGTPLSLEPKFIAKDLLVASIEGISDKNAADELKNRYIYTQHVFESDPENDSFLYDDLIGMAVLVNQKEFGHVKNLYNYGAGDVVVIQQEGSQELLEVPFIKKFIPEINLSKKTISLTPEALETFLELNQNKS